MGEETKEKKTLTESELDEKIEGSVEAKLNSKLNDFAQKTIDEKLEELSDGINSNLSTKVKEIIGDLKNDPEVEKAQEKANEFETPEEYLAAIIEAKDISRSKRAVDPRLAFMDTSGQIKTAGHLEEGDDVQGGFLVPEVYRKDLMMIALENAVVRPNGATVIPPVKTDSINIPYVDDTTHASTVFGGVVGTWTAEAAAKTANKPTFGQMTLTPHKLAGLTYLSHELRDDSAIAIVPLIKRMFGSAWGYYEDDAFINGTGAGQPLGILNCGCLKSVYRNTTSHVYYEDLTEMYSCMLPSSHPYAIWVINPGVLPDLLAMGAGSAAPASGHNVIWVSKDMGAANKIPGTIFGRPFIISEKMQALGTAGDIGYFDFRYYLIFDRQPLTIDFSSHVAFTTDEDCWRFVLRVAGQCWPQSALTLKNSGAPVTTISPFVVLATTTS